MKIRNTALITGASSGIGTELARQLAADNHDLILVARRTDRLEAVATPLRAAGATVKVIAMDLLQQDAVARLAQQIDSSGLRVDVLVNNAGFGLSGPFVDSDAEAVNDMLTLNMVRLTAMTRRFVQPMLRRGRGRVLNVASLAGFQPAGPGMTVYYATKSYVLSFTRGLASELRGTGVTATALCPGPTRTEFDAVAGASTTRLFRWLPLMDARTVAAAGLRAMNAGRPTVVPGLSNALLAFAGGLPPAALSTSLNAFLLKS
jgi:uncharacterized protein